jgi:hypothetical protein
MPMAVWNPLLRISYFVTYPSLLILIAYPLSCPPKRHWDDLSAKAS